MMKVSFQVFMLIACTVALHGCSTKPIRKFPPCWDGSYFNEGDSVAGKIYLLKLWIGGVLAYPTGCDSVAVRVDDFPSEKEPVFHNAVTTLDKPEIFFEADVEGTIGSNADTGKRFLVIRKVDHIVVASPAWARRSSHR